MNKFLIGKPERKSPLGDIGVDGLIILGLLCEERWKRPLGRHRRRWVDNIRVVLWGEVVYSILVRKPEEKRPLGRPRRRWVVNIRKYIWGEWVYRFLVRKPVGNRPLGDLGVNGWIIL